MSTENGDDRTPLPTPDEVIKNPANREIVTTLGNLIVTTRQHEITLRSLYDTLRELATPPSIGWKHKLVEAQEKYVERVSEHTQTLKSSVGG